MLLVAIKFTLGLATGSLILLTSAADSFADALMSALNRWGYAQARIPADEDHPYGHGKLEGVLAVGQGMLLLGIVATLAGSAILGLVEGRALPAVAPAIATLVGSGIVAGLLSWVLARAQRADRSVVLMADAAHYTVDLLAAIAGVAGLVLVEVTGLAWLDSAVALLLALLMARESARVLREGAAELLDEGLPPEELARVQAVLEANAARVLSFHGLRTRRSGPLRFVEVHAIFAPERPLGEVHATVQAIGAEIRAALPDCRALVLPDAAGLEDRVDDAFDSRA